MSSAKLVEGRQKKAIQWRPKTDACSVELHSVRRHASGSTTTTSTTNFVPHRFEFCCCFDTRLCLLPCVYILEFEQTNSA